MTDHSERDEAARKYCGPNPHRAPTWPVRYKAFIAGADWAVKNDPRVLKLVEALKFYVDRHDSACDLLYGEDCSCSDPMVARTALTEWSKP